ncbi:tetratricopeptide repeat protein [Crossiella sp. CA-258035]|uniref:tetratricopeptide repeat protein n=1 Tax=Crossiella sp. CA-258035 TaxID=2981138 RepID=UPI0024BBF360|nr:tetratricopeptide repeat protein [Crossiella sp. CA-258035]WHT22688.1 tetratricopeptide repeat protein [Crossiella sp. CA-258035]
MLLIGFGVLALAVGGVMLVVGLDTADKLGSVVGALAGMIGLGLAVYGVVAARAKPAGKPELPPPSEVSNTVSGAETVSRVVQAGSVGGDAVVGEHNVTGSNLAVAGPGGLAIGVLGALAVASGVSAEPLPPPRVELCLGRDEQITAVTAAWLAGRWAVVVGGPGIGKSTLLGRALGSEAVAAAFTERRYVVSCEGAATAGAVIDKTASSLGVELGDHLRNRVLSLLRAGPGVLVLDNFETLADADPAGAAELLSTLRALPGLVVGIGARGSTVPAGVGVDEVRLGPLAPAAAVEVFLAVAGQRHHTDPALAALVAGLDGVPLAIVLMASLAHQESNLDTLAAAWRAKRTDLLQHGVRPDRTSSLPVSIELSWDRLSPEGKTALSLAALLPDGWPRGRSTLYLPDTLAAGVLELSGQALLHDDEHRQRCLTPLRQHILTHHPPAPAQLRPLVGPVRALTRRAAQIGKADGAAAAADTVPEFTNLVEILHTALPHLPEVSAAVPDLLVFQRFTGLGDHQLGVQALSHTVAPPIRGALLRALALLYFRRGDNGTSRELFDQALPLFRRVGDVLGEAHCLLNLGNVEFCEFDSERARELFNQALPLYRRIADVLGEANCLRRLGEVEFRESDNERARELFDQALPLYQRIQDRYSQAVTHAHLVRVLDGASHIEHRNAMERLATELNLPGFHERLRRLAGL